LTIRWTVLIMSRIDRVRLAIDMPHLILASSAANNLLERKKMTHILSGALVLSLIHALIPNHWIPLVAVGRGEGWSRAETLAVTAVAGAAHISGTIVIGILLGLLSIRISSSYEFLMRVASPLILVLLGGVFVWMDLKGGHSHTHRGVAASGSAVRPKIAIVTSLVLAMFLSPCLEIEAYYLTAGMYGWMGIIGVSLVYFVVTLSGMLLLVNLGIRGLERLRWTYLEHHNKRVTGSILILLGLMIYLVPFR
jgi:nickel/cobalt exporter